MDVNDSSCYYPMDRRLLCIEPHNLQKWFYPGLTCVLFLSV